MGENALAVLRNDFDAALARRAEHIKSRLLGDTTLQQTAASSILGGYMRVYDGLSLDLLALFDVPGQFFFHVPSP
jgi:hypothetical protein